MSKCICRLTLTYPHCPVRYRGPQPLLAASVHVVREDLGEVLGQLGQKEVEAPVVGEVGHQDCPKCHRGPDPSPGYRR